jgi:hypothetical protein
MKTKERHKAAQTNNLAKLGVNTNKKVLAPLSLQFDFLSP